MTDHILEENETDRIVDAWAEISERPEISTAEAVAVCERILAEHEATFPTDEQRERIKARIMEQCECAASGLKPCGMCEG